MLTILKHYFFPISVPSQLQLQLLNLLLRVTPSEGSSRRITVSRFFIDFYKVLLERFINRFLIGFKKFFLKDSSAGFLLTFIGKITVKRFLLDLYWKDHIQQFFINFTVNSILTWFFIGQITVSRVLVDIQSF